MAESHRHSPPCVQMLSQYNMSQLDTMQSQSQCSSRSIVCSLPFRLCVQSTSDFFNSVFKFACKQSKPLKPEFNPRNRFRQQWLFKRVLCCSSCLSVRMTEAFKSLSQLSIWVNSWASLCQCLLHAFEFCNTACLSQTLQHDSVTVPVFKSKWLINCLFLVFEWWPFRLCVHQPSVYKSFSSFIHVASCWVQYVQAFESFNASVVTEVYAFIQVYTNHIPRASKGLGSRWVPFTLPCI